jgi:hypothetical protein
MVSHSFNLRIFRHNMYGHLKHVNSGSQTFYNFECFFSVSLFFPILGYFSPRRGYHRVLKLCMGFWLTKIIWVPPLPSEGCLKWQENWAAIFLIFWRHPSPQTRAPTIFSGVDGGLSRGSCVLRPGSEEQYRQQRKFCIFVLVETKLSTINLNFG